MTVLCPTFARALGPALTICLFCPTPTRALEGYAAEVNAGFSFLRGGHPASAVQSFSDAIRLEANEPAAWVGWGTALLQTHNIKAARNCYTRATNLDRNAAHAALGLGLCDLAEGQSVSARARLTKMDILSARRLVAYLDTLNVKEVSVVGNAPLDRAILAVQLARAGKPADSAAAWKTVIERPDALQPPHFPVTATFDPRYPIAFRWTPNPTLPRPPTPPNERLHGSVLLRAGKVRGVNQAFFEVDGAPAGMTNVPPYSFTWNTAEWPDGRHLVRTTLTRAPGSPVISERWVLTVNGGKTPGHDYPELADIAGMLDAVLAVLPDSRQTQYELAKASMATGAEAEVRDHLEAILAEDPAYRDAADLLRALPSTSGPAQIWRGSTTGKRIALTFDDGPNPRHTPGLLDVLDRLKAPATFFVVGKQAIEHQGMVRRMVASGHEVENHTWNHVNLARKSEDEALRELAATKRLIARLTGSPTRFYRPPGGNTSAGAQRAARALDLRAAMWTFASGKSEGLPVDDMVPRFVRAAKPGAIYLIHNGTDKMETLVALLIKALRSRGYQFVRLDDLLKPLN
jgi:peptidoglycan/xylan/chitin deacetylase (PgdA/CDA1 family)